ncbi:MAG: DUF2191 domain-containing protein [Bryobacteraceae bacterium]
MRTTVRLDPLLFAEAKKLAMEQGTTLTSLIEGAVREVLARRRDSPRVGAAHLTTLAGKGLYPGVNLDDSAGLLDWMEQRNTVR